MYTVNMASGCTHLETLLVSLDDLDNISILLDKDKELEEEITYLFNKVSIFTFKFGKNKISQALNILKTISRNVG